MPSPSRAGADDARRRNNIGTLRMLAALAVLFGHAFVLAHPGVHDPLTEQFRGVLPLQRGLPGQGVALFFVISGFLVTQSFVRRGDLAHFVEARALRIFPALWLALLVTLMATTAITTLPAADFLQSKTTIGFFAHNASLIDLREQLPGVFSTNPASDVNISLWTLPLELAMYGVVAVVGIVGLVRRRGLFNLAVAALFATYVLRNEHLPLLGGRHESELALFFAAGAFLYINSDLIPMRGRAALVLGAGAMGLSAIGAPALDVAIILGFSYSVLWLGLTPRIRLPDLAARGDLSYGTYLYAAPATQLWIAGIGPGSPWALAALTAAVALPLAWLSWHLVERPALRQKGRIVAPLRRPWRRRAEAEDPAPPAAKPEPAPANAN